jgi:Glu-tRNA(Gln) amidotransferase subunit E-like FAD-binding protein
MNLPADTIVPLCEPRWAGLFDRLLETLSLDCRFVAVTLVQRFKAMRRAGVPIDSVTDDEIYAVFEAHAKGLLSREGVRYALRLVASHAPVVGGTGPTRVAGVFAEHCFSPVSESDLDSAALSWEPRLKGIVFAGAEQRARYLTGRLVREYFGRIDGASVAQVVRIRLSRPIGEAVRVQTKTI